MYALTHVRLLKRRRKLIECFFVFCAYLSAFVFKPIPSEMTRKEGFPQSGRLGKERPAVDVQGGGEDGAGGGGGGHGVGRLDGRPTPTQARLGDYHGRHRWNNRQLVLNLERRGRRTNCVSETTHSWGDWRCNALSFAGVITAGRYAASLEPEEREATLESAFFVALVAQGFGTISAGRREATLACLLERENST
ncbi:unnamed protein product [Ectocarpus sp. 12 AP-2014]